MTFSELQKEALGLSDAERQQLINTLMGSLTPKGKRAEFGCMQGTGEILEDIVESALDATEWEVMSEAFA
jgi:hypothetical protein